MKKLRKFIIPIAAIAVIYISLNIGFFAFGKKFVQGEIEKTLKTKAYLENITISFPLTIAIDKLNIEGLLKADSVSLSPSLIALLAKKIVLNELKIVRPELKIQKNADGSLNLPKFSGQGKPPEILLAGLKIRDGKITYIDKKIDALGYKVDVNSINVNISKIAFPPTSLFMRFFLTALVGDSAGNPKGKVVSSGWLDFGKKDMDGIFELRDIDATYLAPYYSKVIPTDKLLSAKLNVNSGLKAKNNNLAIKTHVEFSNMVYAQQKEQKEMSLPDIIPAALNLFSDAQGKMVFDFTINTKLDNPRIDLFNLQGALAAQAVENVANKPPQQVIENVTDTVKQFKEFGKSIKEMFKKD